MQIMHFILDNILKLLTHTVFCLYDEINFIIIRLIIISRCKVI